MTDLPASLEVGRALERVKELADLKRPAAFGGGYSELSSDLRTLVSEIERLQEIEGANIINRNALEAQKRYRAEAEAALAATQSRLARAEEAGEAARIVAWLHGSVVPNASRNFKPTIASIAHAIERGDWKSTPIPTVNGTDEPPNAILAGVIPSDEVAKAEAQLAGAATLAFQGFNTSDTGRAITLVLGELRRLREAGGRVELVEREE